MSSLKVPIVFNKVAFFSVPFDSVRKKKKKKKKPKGEKKKIKPKGEKKKENQTNPNLLQTYTKPKPTMFRTLNNSEISLCAPS